MEFASCRGISVFTEFCGIRYWPVIRGQINTAHFGRFQVAILYLYVIFAIKYMTADGAVMEGMLKLLI